MKTIIILLTILFLPCIVEIKNPIDTYTEVKMNKHNVRKLVGVTLKNIGYHSKDAEELTMGTFAVESNMGEFIYQFNHGPARGFGQMDPLTERYLWQKVIPKREGLAEKIKRLTGVSGPDNFALTSNIAYQIIMTRVKYLSIKQPLPDASDLYGMANYWKEWYNTYEGKGSINDFVRKYKQYVKG